LKDCLRPRRKTRKIFIGPVPVGGGSPVSVQSMTKTDTRDVGATVRQIRALERAGCEIIRLAVPDREAAEALGRIKGAVGIPVIADIHFDWRLALEAIRQGVDGLRINPGNIGARWKVKELVEALKGRDIPLRVGVNAGSLEKDLLKKYGHPVPEAMVESAARQIEILDAMGYGSIKVSLKASNVPATVSAYRLFSRKYDYPLHIGISEAGPPPSGVIKSSVGLGILISEGIGDTMRVSLTASPTKEVSTAYEVLRSLGKRKKGVEIISCPTCGRCRVDLAALVSDVERRLRAVKDPLTVAVMGCAVNGPGEAREADFGIASGRGTGLVFRRGSVVARESEEKLVDSLVKAIEEEMWR
jgi:(E)-4-hydroxy-3-methylbut-2-enyl-diphosphate synthase